MPNNSRMPLALEVDFLTKNTYKTIGLMVDKMSGGINLQEALRNAAPRSR